MRTTSNARLAFAWGWVGRGHQLSCERLGLKSSTQSVDINEIQTLFIMLPTRALVRLRVCAGDGSPLSTSPHAHVIATSSGYARQGASAHTSS